VDEMLEVVGARTQRPPKPKTPKLNIPVTKFVFISVIYALGIRG
jgi:hypothetical protein